MRPMDDRGWRERMLVLQRLVSQGKDAVPVLLEALKTGKAPERILASQALSYLAPHVPQKMLLEAARNDKDPAVRLYAVNALGMQGAGETIDWESLTKAETNRDVRKHIGYAVERKNAPVETSTIEALTRWDTKTIDSASVDRPAPDFELKSATGETVRLSNFRGKRAVVLVFIYGDT